VLLVHSGASLFACLICVLTTFNCGGGGR
jgi:hypothetical protein